MGTDVYKRQVVDNASMDDSEAYITERFPNITYIYNKENLGFARANNQVIRGMD